ncbi:MAG: DUF4340 domain-containing protein [Gemmatimonadota bacterium]|nr:DUF4340 domain-containing protein [Gemmatimonadota bacterium]
MNPKHVKLIAILLGIAVLLYLPRLLSDTEGRGSLEVDDGFAVPLSGTVTRVDIVLLADGDTIRLERGPEEWTVDGLRIDMSKIETLLPVLTDLSSSILVARNPENHDDLGVSETTGRRIDIYTGEDDPASFHLGNRDLGAGGYFVRMGGADEVFRLGGSAGGYLSRDRDGWRQRVIARVDTAAVRDLVIRREDGEVVVQRGDDGWVADGAPADSAAVHGMLGLLPSLSVTSFPTDDEAAAADFSTPDAELDVFAEAGGDVTGRELALGLRFLQDEEAGDWLVQLVDGEEVYRLAAFTVRRLLPERDALLPQE